MCARRHAASAWTDRRLRTPAQFAAVVAARGPGSLRGARRWLALSSSLAPMVDLTGLTATLEAAPPSRGDARARLGLVVPKRFARRALDRNLVKRIAREAMRAALPALDAAVPAALQMDVVIRLKAPLPPVSDLARAQLRVALRAEADALFTALARDAAGRGA